MRIRYQHSHLRFKQRKNGNSCWEFMWREQDASGKRVRRTAVVGTIEEYPTAELAQGAVNGLRMQIKRRTKSARATGSICQLDRSLFKYRISCRLDWRNLA